MILTRILPNFEVTTKAHGTLPCMKHKTKSFRILKLPFPKMHQLYGILSSILFLHHKAAITEYINYISLLNCLKAEETGGLSRVRFNIQCQIPFLLICNFYGEMNKCCRLKKISWIDRNIFLLIFHLTLFVFKASLSPLPPSFSLILHLAMLFLTLNCMSVNNNNIKNVCFSEILEI